MKRKYVALFLSGMLCLTSFTGCGEKDTKKTDTVKATEEVTEEVTEEATEEVTKEPTKEAETTESISLEEIEKAGTIDGNTYTNSIIGYSYSIPDAWTMQDSEQSYEFIASNAGQDKNTLKDAVNKQGVCYISSGVSAEQNASGGIDNYIVQVFDYSKLGNMDLDSVLSALVDAGKQQFVSQGGTCEQTDPEKTTIGSQDVYTVKLTATFSQGVVYQAYHFFKRNGTVVFGAYSTGDEKAMANADAILSSMKFN